MRTMLPTPLSLLSSLIHPYIISITITITVVIETRRREGAREAVNVLSLGWGVKMVGIAIDTSFDLVMHSNA